MQTCSSKVSTFPPSNCSLATNSNVIKCFSTALADKYTAKSETPFKQPLPSPPPLPSPISNLSFNAKSKFMPAPTPLLSPNAKLLLLFAVRTMCPLCTSITCSTPFHMPCHSLNMHCAMPLSCMSPLHHFPLSEFTFLVLLSVCLYCI